MDKETIVHVHKECYSALTKQEILPFIIIWMNLEDDIMLREARHIKRQILYDIAYMGNLCKKKKKKVKLLVTENKVLIFRGCGVRGMGNYLSKVQPNILQSL